MHEPFPSGPTTLISVKEWQIRGLRDYPGSKTEVKH
jgi:hypothetical protein